MKKLPSYLDEYTSDIGIAHVVELRDHNPRHKEIFTQECERLRGMLSGLSVSLQHVGSTSVEGLWAKPIIDILLLYSESTEFEDVKNSLVGAGYIFREDLLPDRRYFVLENQDNIRFFSISVFQEMDKTANGILIFRDNLRNNATLVAEYTTIKKNLSSEVSDRKTYTAKKAEFVNKYSQIQ